MPYYVSRQLYWPDGDPVVEIAAGGLDYANPDMLCTRFAGEGETYTDPRDALAAAISIRDEWQAHERRRKESRINPDDIRIEHGFTAGFTMPFMSHDEDAELLAWAEKEAESLPRCDRCGEIIEGNPIRIWGDLLEERFCADYCAEQRYMELCEFEEDT
jgi:hypothetical protein